MELVAEYQRQRAFRDWRPVFAALPPLQGHKVLDLGCGVGDQAAELVERGARVIGIDANPELLRAAGARRLEHAEFLQHDLTDLSGLELRADGLWSSFVAAYLPDLTETLAHWKRSVRPGGWVALTDIDDLFGHAPLARRTVELLEGYAREALASHRYDFHVGHKLADHLEAAGYKVARVLALPDRELSFDGAAAPDVLEAWRARLERMKLLQEYCGRDFPSVREELLGCLGRADHHADAKVYCAIALA